VNNKLERVPNLRYYPNISLERQKTSVRIVNVPAKILNRHLWNANQKLYCSSKVYVITIMEHVSVSMEDIEAFIWQQGSHNRFIS
jgi:hypothetical protein